MKSKRIKVAHIVESRYAGGFRPLSWDDRKSGCDVVESVDGDRIVLASSGQQSCPQTGWEILLTGGDEVRGFTWTLFGLGSNALVGDA